MKQKPVGYFVIYDNDEGLQSIMGMNENDDGAEGAIEYSHDRPVLFPTRPAAVKAIAISKQFAKLRQAQGFVANEDFTTGAKHLRIVPVYPAPTPGSER